MALNADWDIGTLASELRDLDTGELDLGVIGFSPDELEDLLAWAPPAAATPGLTDPDALPEIQSRAVSRTGDVWILNSHRLMCGDSTSPEDVQRLLNGERATLLHADPPYGMGKEADGVANDNLYREDLDRFQMAWWGAWRAHLEPNATAYIWGKAPDLWRLWYLGGLADSEPMTVRNEIVWDKKNIAGMASDELTQYPEATERCLYIQIGRYIFSVNQTKEDYWAGWESIRTWLCSERDKAGFKPGDVKRICGNHMHGHWFSTSQWVLISEDNYTKLQNAAEGKAFTRSYKDLLREYKVLQAQFNGEIRDPARKEFDAARPYFDNAHDIMRDVWEFPRVVGDERHGHATPKPVALMERALKSSLREGGLCVEPFCGSGSTLIAAERTGRACFTMELQPHYVDVTIRRWQNFTGKEATHSSGRTFSEIEASRHEDEAKAEA